MLPQKLNFKFEEDVFVPELLPYLEAQQKNQLFLGNRGSGKTKFLLQRAIIFTLTKRYFRLVYCRKVQRNIRDSLFQGFKDVISEWNLEPYFKIKESEMDIICTLTGNMLLSFGLDDPAKLKGISDPTHVLWDEMTEGDFQDYAALLGLLRTTKVAKTQFWGTFNPEYGFWGRKQFFIDQENDFIPAGEVPSSVEDTLIYKADFRNNPFINVAEYEATLRTLAKGDENKLTVWINGDWGQDITGDEFYTEYKRSMHVTKVPFLPGKSVHLSYDFNVVPYMTEICAQVNITDYAFEIRIFKEYCLKSPLNSTMHVCKAFLEDYQKHITDLFYYGDASGNSRIAGKGNATAFDDVEKALEKYLNNSSKRVLKRNPSVMKRRDFVNDLLAGRLSMYGLPIILLIDESCTELMMDLQKTKIGIDGKDKERVKDKETEITYEKRGHTSDALDYMVVKLLWDLFKE